MNMYLTRTYFAHLVDKVAALLIRIIARQPQHSLRAQQEAAFRDERWSEAGAQSRPTKAQLSRERESTALLFFCGRSVLLRPTTTSLLFCVFVRAAFLAFS